MLITIILLLNCTSWILFLIFCLTLLLLEDHPLGLMCLWMDLTCFMVMFSLLLKQDDSVYCSMPENTQHMIKKYFHTTWDIVKQKMIKERETRCCEVFNSVSDCVNVFFPSQVLLSLMILWICETFSGWLLCQAVPLKLGGTRYISQIKEYQVAMFLLLWQIGFWIQKHKQ